MNIVIIDALKRHKLYHDQYKVQRIILQILIVISKMKRKKNHKELKSVFIQDLSM